jgi:hydroxymethylpyrimidine pyrophosphatase-like HAD family hydrolase
LIKMVGVGDDPEAMALAVEEVRRTLGQRVSAALSQPYYVDITHPDANKGEVVRVLSRLLGVPPIEMATIGDMPNDVQMFERSGISIAMANAGTDVRNAAAFVTASNTEEGFALAMERYVLSGRSAA